MRIKVKIAVAANREGEWNAYGWHNAEDWEETMEAFEQLANEQRFWVEAEIEIPDTPVVQGAAAAA